jgi:hypothetical protein
VVAGGGAGGFRESSGTVSGCYTASPLGACVAALPVSATTYPITVGGGGAGAPSANGKGGDGSNSVFQYNYISRWWWWSRKQCISRY